LLFEPLCDVCPIIFTGVIVAGVAEIPPLDLLPPERLPILEVTARAALVAGNSAVSRPPATIGAAFFAPSWMVPAGVTDREVTPLCDVCPIIFTGVMVAGDTG